MVRPVYRDRGGGEHSRLRSGWLPVAGDFDVDGKADPVVYNPLAGAVGGWRGLFSTLDYTELEGEFGGPGYDAVAE